MKPGLLGPVVVLLALLLGEHTLAEVPAGAEATVISPVPAEAETLQRAGFSESAILLISRCPLHAAFATRVQLLEQVGSPLAHERVESINRSVEFWKSSLLSSNMNAQFVCKGLIQDLDLPVERIPSPAEVRAAKQREQQNQVNVGLVSRVALGSLCVILMTAFIQRRWQAREARRLRAGSAPPPASENPWD